MEIRKGGFFIVEGFMINDLDLKGNELLVYALIYGYSKDENKYFTGSLSYLMAWTGISSKTTVLNILKNLTERGLLIKKEIIENNIKYCEYKAVRETKTDLICKNNSEKNILKNSDLLGKETLPNNINNNNMLDNMLDNIDNSIDDLREKEKSNNLKIFNKNNLEENLDLGSGENPLGSGKVTVGYIKNSTKSISKLSIGISENPPNSIINNILDNINNSIDALRGKEKSNNLKNFISQKYSNIILENSFP